jgi:pyruvate dehydrogenase E2 component (dihydrolipoamide acetyltransferase)
MAAMQVTVPDIGDFKDIPVIEIHVQPGDAIKADDPLVTLESDKATMDVPADQDGTVDSVLVKIGDKVSQGSPIVMLKAADGEAPVTPPPSVIAQQEPTPAPKPTSAPPAAVAPAAAPPAKAAVGADEGQAIHASPSVRRLARELEVDLAKVKGSGEKGRITKEDVKAHIQGAVPAAAAATAAGTGIPEIPAVDFAKFGEIEEVPLSRIKKISGPHLHRAWLNVPQVTHHDEADITELDAYRKELDAAAKEQGYRVTLLAFLIKAAVSALKKFPEVNSSLAPDKEHLILKKYIHMGIAVDTPGGLVVPVLRDVDKKGIEAISRELAESSQKAREGKLSSAELQGATFTISSLGGIGGTGFTPLVNPPEVAILGAVRARMAPVWDGSQFVPRLMLPLALSYDHRVVDGALAARFTRHLCYVLEDVRRLVL